MLVVLISICFVLPPILVSPPSLQELLVLFNWSAFFLLFGSPSALLPALDLLRFRSVSHYSVSSFCKMKAFPHKNNCRVATVGEAHLQLVLTCLLFECTLSASHPFLMFVSAAAFYGPLLSLSKL